MFNAKQRPISFSAVHEKASATQARKTFPSGHVANTQDANIPLALQLGMADRAGSTVTEAKAEHHATPKKVAKFFETTASAEQHHTHLQHQRPTQPGPI